MTNLNIKAAEKQRQVEFATRLTEELRSGNMQVPAEGLFSYDTQRIEWDFDNNGSRLWGQLAHSDIADAVLYAWRHAATAYRRLTITKEN